MDIFKELTEKWEPNRRRSSLGEGNEKGDSGGNGRGLHFEGSDRIDEAC